MNWTAYTHLSKEPRNITTTSVVMTFSGEKAKSDLSEKFVNILKFCAYSIQTTLLVANRVLHVYDATMSASDSGKATSKIFCSWNVAFAGKKKRGIVSVFTTQTSSFSFVMTFKAGLQLHRRRGLVVKGRL